MDAWAQLGWVPRAVDGLLVAPLAVWLAFEHGLGMGAAAAPFLLVLAPIAGAEAGLSACRGVGIG